MDRKLWYEDDWIRIWESPSSGEWLSEKEAKKLGVLQVRLEKEEFYETRTYKLKDSLDAFDKFRKLMDEGHLPLLPLGATLTEGILSIVENVWFKIVAKRRKVDGLISYLVRHHHPTQVSVGESGELVTESEYREAVKRFEETSPLAEVLDIPAVIGLQQWRQYTKKKEEEK